jgi:2-polyprenyl-3-methyl-5-hydroxy-6-metoxy-1,4-benzoquinol methylase
VSGRRRGEQLWNLNIHYDALLDSRVPPGVLRVLDVGCGDGLLAARLTRRIPDVTALDVDAPVLKRARDRFAGAPVRWMQGDVMTADLAGFDAVVSNAVLHHLPDTGAALRRFPGRVLISWRSPRV